MGDKLPTLLLVATGPVWLIFLGGDDANRTDSSFAGDDRGRGGDETAALLLLVIRIVRFLPERKENSFFSLP